MTHLAALIYWAIVLLWLTVLATVVAFYLRNSRAFGSTRLLLAVLAIDTTRNIVENVYFGVYFGSQYGLFPGGIVGVLGNPKFLIIPKVINVGAACVVLGLLLRRWLPMALRERAVADNEMHLTEDALRQEFEERRRIFDTSLDLILITDRKWNLIRVSPSSVAILGYSPDEMIGRNTREFIYPADLEGTRAEMRLARTGRDTQNFETRYVHKSGYTVTLGWSGVWSGPEQKHYFFGRDMTERKLAEEKLKHLAHYDQLTGLPNRTSLQTDLRELTNLCADFDYHRTSIAMFDLDGFKDINDTLGHPIGDQLLQEVAQRLTTTADKDVRVYRLGGDEFILIFPDCGDPRTVAEIVKSLLKRLGERFEINEQNLFIGASVGIAIAPTDATEPNDLMRAADIALYEAKNIGRGTYCFYDPKLQERLQNRAQLGRELQEAFVNSEFELFYQPVASFADNRVVSFEALLRWNHPKRGMVSPAEFIPIAEEIGLIVPLGEWVIRTACTEAAKWPDDIQFAVNLSAAQLANKNLANVIVGAIAAAGIPPSKLELELTESVLIQNTSTNRAKLKSLHELGIQFAIDDFGTGYSSLSYLLSFPFHRIKIDRSFINGIADNENSRAIVRAIGDLAQNLNMRVTAEGIETERQLQQVRKLGCTEIQGYLLSRPRPAPEISRLLPQRNESVDNPKSTNVLTARKIQKCAELGRTSFVATG